MGLFDGGYIKPGVYTDVTETTTSVSLFTAARVPVLIGEGQEFFSTSNQELFRGSSATADDQVVGEDISDQVTTSNFNTFQLTYWPVVTGNGTGTITTDPSFVTVTDNGVPVTVLSLSKTGVIVTQDLIPVGDTLLVNYFFKRTDTLISNENLSYQVPSFASLTIQTGLVLSVTLPGALGNLVTLTITLATTGSGVSDTFAVTGIGTDAISIEARNSDNSIRTLGDIATLINAGIPTADAGYLTVQSLSPSFSDVASQALSATALAGGGGQNTNTAFKVSNVPVVDGSNGGIVTTSPTDIKVLVNGAPTTVASLDGLTGMFSLTNPVSAGATVTVTYYTNTYQDTTDILPASGVTAITQVGLAPGTSDYIEGTDYVLSGASNNLISWGASTSTAAGISTAGFVPFDGTVITTTLVDEKVYLRPVTGVVNSKNTIFTLQDTPTDGSGLDRATDNPVLVQIYVGSNPVAALTAGAVPVIYLSGATSEVTLFNPPAVGNNVYASYYRSILDDHTNTLTVVNPSTPGIGTYSITNENGLVSPTVALSASSVTDASFADTGIVWPSDFSDLSSDYGAVDEVVTLTFQNDGLGTVQTPAVQATSTVEGLIFTSTNPGTAGNNTTITFVGVTATSSAQAVQVADNAISVFIVNSDGSTRELSDIINLFSGGVISTPASGVIICTAANGTTISTTASPVALTHFTGGAAQVLINTYANRFLVTSSVTGGSNGVGYLGQTYVDTVTDLKFTIVDSKNALAYGYTSNPSPSYFFQPGDTLTFTVSKETPFVTGSIPVLGIPGLRTEITTTFGMNVGDTAVISTFNKAGNTPAIGEYYYVSYTVGKSTSDFALQLFSSASDAYAQYGQPSTANRLSLAVQLLTSNGAQTFGCIQVPKSPLTSLGTDASFTTAIQTLATALPGATNEQKAGIIVPLSTSAAVQQYLARFLSTQSGPRQKGEAMGFIGFSSTTTPNQAIATATSINNQRIVAVAPFSAAVNLTDLAGNSQEFAISGEFMATALAGLNLNPSNDVATTLTNQSLVGISRLLVRYNSTVLDQMAAAGITVLNDNNGSLIVRDYLSTDVSDAIYSEPTSTTIVDSVRQQFRANLKQFIGQKMTSSLVNDITVVCNAMLGQFVANEILTTYTNLVVSPDATNPTLINVTVSIKPMFCLKYISIVFNVTLNP